MKSGDKILILDKVEATFSSHSMTSPGTSFVHVEGTFGSVRVPDAWITPVPPSPEAAALLSVWQRDLEDEGTRRYVKLGNNVWARVLDKETDFISWCDNSDMIKYNTYPISEGE